MLYRALTSALHPLIPLYLRRRAARGKEDLTRMGERFGVAGVARPEGKLLWFHAASVGEFLSILPLIKSLYETYPRFRVLLTTVTVTSAEMAVARLPEGAIHQFAPVDTPQAVSAFLAHWQPSVAFFVDSELWPNMLHQTHQRGCLLFLLNARMSERSSRRWQYLRSVMQGMLSCFSLILAKSEEDAEHFRAFGATQVVAKGNLKFSAPPLEADAGEAEKLAALISNRPVWLASSTHAGEEAMIAEVHQQLKHDYPTLLTLLVPRHSRRGGEIAAELRVAGLRVAQRSKEEAIHPETDMYLADTMGELGLFYRLAPIVFVGGSLIPHGGQNPFEPARLNCAILYGQYMHNFTEFCAELEGIEVHSATELTAQVKELLRHPEKTAALAEANQQTVAAQDKVLPEVLATLAPYLKELTP